MASIINAGVIGLGIMGRQHVVSLQDHRAVEVIAVADIRRQVAEDVAAKCDAEAFSEYQEMLKRHLLDLVVVATPDPLHREPTLAAIKAGVPNILLEKPLATSVADAEAIYDAAEQAGTRLFVNFANRAFPMDIATRYVIQKGLLGRVVYGESRLDDNITVPTQMWGARSKDWAAGSSSAHFLLSHVVDLLRWQFAPAEVRQVYAISQQEVLGYTPDVYDAYLTFDSGLKVRVKAEWIKYIDGLVEFYMCFSGSEGTLIHNRRPGFGCQEGWRANLSKGLDTTSLMEHQQALLDRGVNVSALVHRPNPTLGHLSAGGSELTLSLERLGPSPAADTMPLNSLCIDAIVEDTMEPSRWQGNGPLPNHVDGLRQTQVVAAIIESSETGKVVDM